MEYRNRTMFLKTGTITISLRMITIPITYLYVNQNTPNVLHMPYTGWPKSKFFISNSHSSETMYIWPHVVKTKMGLKSGGFFWEIVNKQLKIVNKQLKTEKNPPLLKHILALPMIGQICLFQGVLAIWNCNFWFGSPCSVKFELFHFSYSKANGRIHICSFVISWIGKLQNTANTQQLWVC